MVFNEEIILGGPLPLVLWSGFIAIIGLTAFAAVLEGFLWQPMRLWMRVLLVPGVVGLFWPDLMVEIVSAVLILVLLGLNWRQVPQVKSMHGGLAEPVRQPET